MGAWTSARVSYLYDLMDSAYDAAAIHGRSQALGHAPIIDRNFRADHEAKAAWDREVERLKLIHMPDFDDRIYDFRTMAERVNARLKDEFGARFLRVRGAVKAKCSAGLGDCVRSDARRGRRICLDRRGARARALKGASGGRRRRAAATSTGLGAAASTKSPRA